MADSNRLTVVDKEAYSVDLEYSTTYAVLHLPYVEKFSKSVYMDMKTTILDIHNFVLHMGFPHLHAALFPNDEKMKKFVNKIGFAYLGSAEGMDVYQFVGAE